MAVTAKELSLGTKPTMLAVVFVLLALFCSSISLLDAVYVVHFPFGATMSSVIVNLLQILLLRTEALQSLLWIRQAQTGKTTLRLLS